MEMQLESSATSDLTRIINGVREWCTALGYTGAVNWVPLIEETPPSGFWSEITFVLAATSKRSPIVLAEELASRVPGIQMTPKGGIYCLPTSISVYDSRLLDREEFFTAVPESGATPIIWCAPPLAATTEQQIMTSLRLLAAGYVQSRLSRLRGEATFLQTSDGKLFEGGRSGEKELADLISHFIDSSNNCQITPCWQQPASFRWLWSNSYSKLEFNRLRAEDPAAKLLYLPLEATIPRDFEVDWRIIAKEEKLHSLLLLLAGSDPGREVVPWMACFQEEANLSWSLQRLQDRIELFNEAPLLASAELQRKVYLTTTAEGKILFEWLRVDRSVNRGAAYGEVGIFLQRLKGAIRSLNRIMDLFRKLPVDEPVRIYVGEWITKLRNEFV